MTYIDYTRILKPGQINKNVVIPGYQEIVDMIKEYDDDVSLLTRLNGDISTKDVVRYMDCNSPELSTPENSIIVLRKKYRFLYSNQSIDCDHDIYTQLASHNFRIFIQEILQWNPFLNIPIKQKKIVVHDVYGGNHIYSSLPMFKSEEWWNQQQWWIEYKETLPKPSDVTPSPTPSPYSAPPEPEVTIESLQADIARLKNLIKIYIDLLIQNGIQPPSIDD